MPRGTKLSVEISETVTSLVLRGYGKAQIYRHLEKGHRIDRNGRPSKSTIDRLVDKLRPEDASGTWSFAEADADPDDARLVLEALAAAIERTEGRVVRFSRDLAAWVVRVRRAAPSIPPWESYVMATQFQNATAQGWETQFLELTLAFRPWESEAANRRFQEHLPSATPGQIVALPNMVSMGGGETRFDLRVGDQSALTTLETATVTIHPHEDEFVLSPAVAVVPSAATATAEALAPTLLVGGKPME